MRLAAPIPPNPSAHDVPAAVGDALRVLGQGPAVTLLLPSGRQEQGMASLAQWAAKGAHLLESDLLLGPGDSLRLDAPLSWTTAAVCLAAWWAGIAVTLDEDAEVAVVHEHHLASAPHTRERLLLGDRIDGAPEAATGGEPWVRAVQSFPDHPPTPRGSADTVALRAAGRQWSQQEVLDAARELGTGTLGIEAAELVTGTELIAVAARPLVSGSPTVVLRGADRDVAAGDRVRHWL